jgi:pyruvate/2-oxoglutarate/acetoin dehydrogenase E1 component/TPP-dependent pyruvate/acetoin dehydrogenase alpha subunit
MSESATEKAAMTLEEFKTEVLIDYRIAYESRQASLVGRKEVLTGKAKFGIFGDGKEVAQLAMAKFFNTGDFRSGYYRDQTFMFAKGMSNIREFFAQLYADPDVNREPCSAGRSMNGHFGTRLLNEDGSWKSQTNSFNSSADISPTAGQMPRLLGLAYASKLYRENKELNSYTDFSVNGNEIAFGTIGNASTSEGGFWEVINAGGVLQVPMLLSIWDDEYGISVHAKYQTTKENLSSILSGFKTDEHGKGYELFTVKGWDYPALIKTYQKATKLCREFHTPVIIHVIEMTQPQGHSTSGSHERYKSKERLNWEAEYDCIAQMQKWIIETGIATKEEIETIEKEAQIFAKAEQKAAWNAYLKPIIEDRDKSVNALQNLATGSLKSSEIEELANSLKNMGELNRKDIFNAINTALRATISEKNNQRTELINLYNVFNEENKHRYNSNVYSESNLSALKISEIKPVYSDSSKTLDGREIVQACFDAAFNNDNRIVAFGEDVGKIGDVNQGFAGMQEKYGELRVTDTGIRELSIIGQAIGLAMRGLRPIAEIQYLDYLLYAIQIMSDDIATLQYRTMGGQKAPVIIRTRGHRLEGVWHSGSPMGMIINAVRGMHVLVPRNMTQASGFYNTLLKSDEPALVIECLNGYRLKEILPDNIGEFTLSLGVPEILREGSDLTLVTYGSSCRIAEDACNELEKMGISVELIDVQTLLPFDTNHMIVESVKKTNKVVFLDEDVPSGATSYMMQQIIENQEAYKYLDTEPISIASKEHRPAYGTDGDYFSKPNVDEVFNRIYDLMHNYNPEKYPSWM